MTMAITKALVSIAIAVGTAVAVEGPASADQNAFGPQPFGGLGCNCRVANPDREQAINRGIRDGLAAPTQQPRP
jgi:hypothetical protein